MDWLPNGRHIIDSRPFDTCLGMTHFCQATDMSYRLRLVLLSTDWRGENRCVSISLAKGGVNYAPLSDYLMHHCIISSQIDSVKLSCCDKWCVNPFSYHNP